MKTALVRRHHGTISSPSSNTLPVLDNSISERSMASSRRKRSSKFVSRDSASCLSIVMIVGTLTLLAFNLMSNLSLHFFYLNNGDSDNHSEDKSPGDTSLITNQYAITHAIEQEDYRPAAISTITSRGKSPLNLQFGIGYLRMIYGTVEWNRREERSKGLVNDPAKNKLANQLYEKFGVVQYQVYRKDVIPAEDTLPMVMVVHHREFFVGCYNFERFFHPSWETIVVIEEDVAEQLDLKTLARMSSSPAIHLALLDPDDFAAEWLGRQVALHIMDFESGLNHKPIQPLLLSTNCDIQPLPAFHSMHKPYDQTIARMVQVFTEESRLNNQELEPKTLVNDYNHMYDIAPLDETMCKPVFEKKDRPLLALNTVMVETLPSSDSLEGSLFHGWFEAGLEKRWEEKYPTKQQHGIAEPWVSDVSTWLEDHMTLYNVTLLKKVVETFGKVSPLVSETDRTMAQTLCRKGWKNIRLNDEIMFYDLAKPQYKSSGERGTFSLFDSSRYGSEVAMELLFKKSVMLVPRGNSPLQCLREHMALRTRAGIDTAVSCIIGYSHLQPNHLPKNLWSETISSNLPIFEALMQIHGYELADANDEFLVFVRLPLWHSAPHEKFVNRLQQQTSGIVSGLTGNLWYVMLPKNGIMKEESFFRDNRLPFEFFRGTNRVIDSSFDSEFLCSFHNTTKKIEHLSKFARKMDPFISNLCPPDMDWRYHDPVTGVVQD